MEASSVSDLLFKQLNYRGEKQKIISSNIANINTNEFKTKELEFKKHLEDSFRDVELGLKTTNSAHIHIDTIEYKEPNKYIVKETEGLTSANNGNNVNIDSEMAKMAKNNIIFSAIQSSIRKDSMWFKTMIDASSKN